MQFARSFEIERRPGQEDVLESDAMSPQTPMRFTLQKKKLFSKDGLKRSLLFATLIHAAICYAELSYEFYEGTSRTFFFPSGVTW